MPLAVRSAPGTGGQGSGKARVGVMGIVPGETTNVLMVEVVVGRAATVSADWQ